MSAFAFRRINGPVLEPVKENPWESQAVFNPGAVREKDNIHVTYRAVEGKNFSSIGARKTPGATKAPTAKRKSP